MTSRLDTGGSGLAISRPGAVGFGFGGVPDCGAGVWADATRTR
jgi:hypothetical protein